MARIVCVVVLITITAIVYSIVPSRSSLKTVAQAPDLQPIPAATPPIPQGQTATVYLFLSPHCPISNYYLPVLNRFYETYQGYGIEFVGIVSSQIASQEEIEAHRQRYAVRFPIVCDSQNKLSRQWGATNTPQAIVVDDNQSIIYSGRIDDLYADIGQKRLYATQYELDEVLKSLATGGIITVSHTQPVGCMIAGVCEPTDDRVTYHEAIAALLYRECAQCHRPGQVAPFSLLTYEDAQRHADQIKLVIEKKLMPPWKAAPNFGHFLNEQILTESERHLLLQWIENGMPEGDPKVGPKPPRFNDGWQLGTPDLVLEMPEAFEVPADGPDIYQHFVLPTGLTEDRLVSAVEFQPGAAEVVHHSGFYIDTQGDARRLDELDPSPGYSNLGVTGFLGKGSLGGWGPGRMPNRLPPNMGRPLWKNSDLVLQIHYHPVGRPVKDVSRIGIYFAPRTADHLVCEILVADFSLNIPADEDNHYHRAEYTLPVDTTLLNTNPHMHLLGKSAKCWALLPDGSERPLIHVPQWDFYWQTEYVYREPVRLPAGTKLILECWFDNSTGNPLNFHNPPQTVHFGEDSTDEMAICYFRVTTETIEGFNKLFYDTNETFNRLWQRYQEIKPTWEQARSN